MNGFGITISSFNFTIWFLFLVLTNGIALNSKLIYQEFTNLSTLLFWSAFWAWPSPYKSASITKKNVEILLIKLEDILQLLILFSLSWLFILLSQAERKKPLLELFKTPISPLFTMKTKDLTTKAKLVTPPSTILDWFIE